MGMDKALLPFRAKPLVEHTLAIMRRVCSPITIVGDPAKFSAYGIVVPDIIAGSGPLAGIHAGLKNSPADLNLFLAVDMPFVSEELLNFLLAVAEQSDASVIVPRTSRGLQPLCAAYRRGFAPIAEDFLRAGKYKIDAAFVDLQVRIVEEAELAKNGFSEQNFFNINTPEDLLQAETFANPA